MHKECRIMMNVMASYKKAELGGLFENVQKEISTRTSLTEMVHQQLPTLLATDNTASNRIVN